MRFFYCSIRGGRGVVGVFVVREGGDGVAGVSLECREERLGSFLRVVEGNSIVGICCCVSECMC